jgi:hypothetical protein
MDGASLTSTPLALCQKETGVSGHERCDPRDRATATLAGVALGLAVTLGLLVLPLRKFRVNGAQTPLTGHLQPPPHRVGAPKATGGMLQIGEPSMDRVRHEQRLPHGIVGLRLAVYRDSAVSAGNVTRVGRRGGICPHYAELARVSIRLPRSFGTENDPAYKGCKSTFVQPTSSIPTLSVGGADNPASRNQPPRFCL